MLPIPRQGVEGAGGLAPQAIPVLDLGSDDHIFAHRDVEGYAEVTGVKRLVKLVLQITGELNTG